MVSDSLSYYKPSKRAWIAVSVGFLALAAIVYIICGSDIKVQVQNNLGLSVEIGEGAKDINVFQTIQQRPMGL